MTQPKQMQPSNSSWRPEIRPISTRLPWNHTWSNLFRESWSIRCCSESSCPWQMQRAPSTHTWQVTQTYTWQVTHTHTWEVTDLTVLYLNMFCDQLHFHCHPLRGAASNGKGGESHQRDAEDLWGLRLRVWPAGSRAEWSRQTGKHNDTHTHTWASPVCITYPEGFFFPPPSGDGDLDGGVSGPLVGGLVEPTALSGSLEEGTRADAVWWVKSLLHTSLLAQVITDGE